MVLLNGFGSALSQPLNGSLRSWKRAHKIAFLLSIFHTKPCIKGSLKKILKKVISNIFLWLFYCYEEPSQSCFNDGYLYKKLNEISNVLYNLISYVWCWPFSNDSKRADKVSDIWNNEMHSINEIDQKQVLRGVFGAQWQSDG